MAIKFASVGMAFYGPDNVRASKVVVGILPPPTSEPERQGFRVHLVEMTGDLRRGTHRQQGVDEALIAQMSVSAARPQCRSIVLTSGDGDFVPAVREARQAHGVTVVLFGYDVNVSGELKAAADEFWSFEAHGAELSRGPRGPRR